MSFPKDDNELDSALTAAFPSPPPADFDAWRQQHPQAVACLSRQRPTTLTTRRRVMRRTMIFAAAAAVLVAVWLGIVQFSSNGKDSLAFATTLAQIEKAKTVTWKMACYEHVTSKDGKRTWLHTRFVQECYKGPGLHRSVRLDDKGEPESVTIRDTIRGRELTLYPKKKEATVAQFNPWPDDPGPFPVERKDLNEPNLQWVGKRKTPTQETHVFRHAFRDDDNERDWSRDFWIDVETKQLVALYIPGADIYDPSNDPLRNNPPEQQSSGRRMMGGGWLDMRYDMALDDSLFRLEPPEGYTVTIKQRDRVTEKEMIEYFGIVADFNDKTFPDKAFSSGKLLSKMNITLKKPRKELTKTEQDLLDTDMRYSRRFGTVTNAPVLVFFAWDPDSVVKGSFRYLGNGVKLGDKDRIVCWYKLKDAKAPNIYRVVYGDLSVKDVLAKDLPLPVEP